MLLSASAVKMIREIRRRLQKNSFLAGGCCLISNGWVIVRTRNICIGKLTWSFCRATARGSHVCYRKQRPVFSR